MTRPDKSKLTARALAYTVIKKFDPNKTRPDILDLGKKLHKTNEPQRCTDLVNSTARHCLSLDKIIIAFGGRSISRISRLLLGVLRVSVYEICFCMQTPQYCIVNEAVEYVKSQAGKRQVAFVNAVLRQICRGIENRSILLTDSDPKKTVITSLSTGCEFKISVFPDPDLDQSDYLASSFSLPKWLIDIWLNEFGYKRTREIALASNRRPGMYLRVNTIKTSNAYMLQALQEYGLDPVLCESGLIWLRSTGNITKLPGFKQGYFSVQDQSAYNAVKLLNPQKEWTVLDLCAAPGGKTTHLAELTMDKAHIFATDINKDRLHLVQDNILRLGLHSVKIIDFDSVTEHVRINGLFDTVLVDVPCSNLGVLAKRVEVRYRLKPGDISKLEKIQLGILNSAALLVRPLGIICYSTCSIYAQENTQIVQSFLQDNPQFKLKTESLILPSAQHPDTDGAYCAILMRTE